MADAQIIDDLGGPTAVATELSAPVQTVHSWKKNGIPRWRRDAIKDLAARKQVALPADFLPAPADDDAPASMAGSSADAGAAGQRESTGEIPAIQSNEGGQPC